MSKLNATFPNVEEWLGIPYAKAERFQKPTLLNFDPSKKYDKKGFAPLQAGDTSWLEADTGFSEDCLNLNVWAPVDRGDELLPVVIYIYGGGWVLGSNGQTTSNAAGLAATGRVIGVSINYRLGPFGWLSLAQFGGKLKDATNLGLQDMITALKWVKENIATFGGDPNNVTLTGHSAGAYSCLHLLAAPEADGLFHHIAAFSGMPARLVPAWASEERALEVLKAFDCVDNPEKLLEVDAYELAEAMSATQAKDPGVQHGIDNIVIAVTDDRHLESGVIAEHVMDLLKSGQKKDIDILFSSTSEENFYWVLYRTEDYDPITINNLVEEYAHANRMTLTKAREIIDTFDINNRKPVEVRGYLLTDFSFTLPQTRGAIAHANAGGKAYLMAIGPVEGAEYAVHGTEMYGIVGQTSPNASEEQKIRDTQVRDAILDLAEGKDLPWPTVTKEKLYVNGVGNLPYDATEHAKLVLETFDGVERP
ncbi:carboxylesterase family protein [Streptococcus merionis]|uniref:Carboxylic ester hydrolase n=1 Tax=Streptococcus merionis TaxID=400065 RepID=A0A239SRC1_9STRE|nr:carboxylesterase family protein [Streptococcus merionis]SNU87960.1 carboxylesterase type B [Streptococcus merionis]